MGRDYALPTQEPLIQFPAVEEGPTSREVVLGYILLNYGFLKGVFGPAEVCSRLFGVHPLLGSHFLKSLSGASKAVYGS
jgi:hypothetical protein